VVSRAPTHGERLAVDRLLGPRPGRGDSLTVDLTALERVLRAGLWPAGLADAVQQLSGPVTVRRDQRQREAAAWAAAAAAFEPAVTAHPVLRRWFDSWAAGGGLKRLGRAEARRLGRADLDSSGPAEVAGAALGAAARVLAALPAAGELRAVFAQRVLGEAHGLDRGRPVAGVAGAAVEVLTGCADTRGAWEALGILTSNLASTVLTLGVPAVGSGGSAATAAALEAARTEPMALVLTLDQVRSGAIAPLDATGVVLVCENPSILESTVAQLRLAPPASRDVARACLVCVQGQPSVAALEAIVTLASAGAAVRYHGDFDWAGLGIAAGLARTAPWRPWRFGAADYLAALERSRVGAAHLTGRPVESPWDPELAQAMRREGIALEEEAVVDQLVEDALAAW
jgi:uncharacterized protein (TIGR02679 family)